MREPLDRRDDFEDVRRLISAEEKEALESFRAGDFEKRLRARIAAAREEKRPLRLFGKPALPVSAAATAFVLVAAAAAFLLFYRTGRVGRGEGLRLASAVGMLPGLAGAQGDSSVRVPATAPVSAGWVGDVLRRAYAQKREVESRAALPPASLSPPRLSLEKKMEILFKDRVLERVLVSIREKSKEA